MLYKTKSCKETVATWKPAKTCAKCDNTWSDYHIHIIALSIVDIFMTDQFYTYHNYTDKHVYHLSNNSEHMFIWFMECKQ